MTAATTWRLIGLDALSSDQDVELSVLQPAVVAPGDTQYDKVWLLLQRENGAFVDGGPQGRTFTVSGAVGSSDVPNSNYLESGRFGASKSVSVAAGKWGFPGDFTIELLFKPLAAFGDLNSVITRGRNGAPLGSFTIFRYQGKFQLYWVATGSSGTGGNYPLGEFGDVPVGTWAHLAVTRANGVVRCWKDGVQTSSKSGPETSGPTNQLSDNLEIGGTGFYGSSPPDFLVNDLRITIGVARYTGRFKAPSAPYPDFFSDGSITVHPESSYVVSSDTAGQLVEVLSEGNPAAVVSLPSRASGFSLQYAFSEPSVFNAINVGATANKLRFLAGCTLQYLSTQGVWVTDADIVGIPWPGNQSAVLWAQYVPRAPSIHTKTQVQVQLGSAESDFGTRLGASSGCDMENGGNFRIYGSVEQKLAGDATLPLKRRVRLHRSRDGLLVRETWSDAQGNYRFDGITDRYKYDAIAWDHEGLQQSVVANDLTPEVMP